MDSYDKPLPWWVTILILAMLAGAVLYPGVVTVSTRPAIAIVIKPGETLTIEGVRNNVVLSVKAEK